LFSVNDVPLPLKFSCGEHLNFKYRYYTAIPDQSSPPYPRIRNQGKLTEVGERKNLKSKKEHLGDGANIAVTHAGAFMWLLALLRCGRCDVLGESLRLRITIQYSDS